MAKKLIQYQLLFNCCNVNLSVKLNKSEFDLLKKSDSKFIELPIKNRKIIIKDSFFKYPVSDIVRYSLSFNDSKWVFNCPKGNSLVKYENNLFDVKLEEYPNNIFLILESPHKEEYLKEEMKPIGPAIGKTGEYIFKHFISGVLPLLESKGLTLDTRIKYNFCLINPVPYQTSLGHIYDSKIESSLRNNVFKKMFGVLNVDFAKLLDKHKPIIIINSCTVECKKEVQAIIDERIFESDNFTTNHPSNWNSFKSFEKIDKKKQPLISKK